MARKVTLINIHGQLLKGLIQSEHTLEEFGEKIGVTRMTVHQWVTSGRISPRHLSEVVKTLNLSAEDVRMLERVELTALERNTTKMRQYRNTLFEIRKQIDEVLEEPAGKGRG